ncbi:MAG: hypothetical protein U0S50_01690 [Sphingopyxis sp.]|uniref:hypothetical protein n=1 Tax=Sphingopyxis sp. TaxID=1908224 RepID=UPI002AB935B4|nr:hypothetical protein [Sphingopyxis sp.]MDZ3830514.1 hypothetical protein [Sphingopyxis sp.]
MQQLSQRIMLTFAVLCGAAFVPATAKDKEKAVTPSQIRELYVCRDIADSAQRLECFDRKVEALAVAEANREISFTDKATAKKTRRGLFGFVLPNIDGLIGDTEDIESIETTIKSASMGANGRYRFSFADGSVWYQIDDIQLFRDPSGGKKIVIRKAALGSFLGKIEGERAIRMRRER